MTVRVFVNSVFLGYYKMKDVIEINKKHHDIALERNKHINADHMIYAWYELDEQGRVDTARFYDGIPKNDRDFEPVAMMKNSHIYAIHKHE